MKKIVRSIIWIAAIFVAFAVVANVSYYLRPKTKIKKPGKVAIERKTIARLDEKIKVLMDNDLLVKINPQMNEAFIDSAIWIRLNHQTKENVSRTMAFYCGQEKGTGLNWVDIKDYRSGRRLAKYSESLGFKIY